MEAGPGRTEQGSVSKFVANHTPPNAQPSNPDFEAKHPRGDGGQFVHGNGGGTGNPNVVLTGATAAATPMGLETLTPAVRAMLARVAAAGGTLVATGGAATAAAALAAIGVLVVPLGNPDVVDGTLPGNPDISYHSAEGELTIVRKDPDGNPQVLYSGRAGEDHLFRTEDGTVIGRDLGVRNVAIDSGALLAAKPAEDEGVANSGTAADILTRVPPIPRPRTPECDEEWAAAEKFCDDMEEDGKFRVRGRQVYGGGYQKCLLGQVSQACGGNAIVPSRK